MCMHSIIPGTCVVIWLRALALSTKIFVSSWPLEIQSASLIAFTATVVNLANMPASIEVLLHTCAPVEELPGGLICTGNVQELGAWEVLSGVPFVPLAGLHGVFSAKFTVSDICMCCNDILYEKSIYCRHYFYKNTHISSNNLTLCAYPFTSPHLPQPKI